MVQRVQCRHGALCSERNSCKTMKTNIFTSGMEASFLVSRVLSEQSWGSIEGPVGEHLGVAGRQRDELNIL